MGRGRERVSGKELAQENKNVNRMGIGRKRKT